MNISMDDAVSSLRPGTAFQLQEKPFKITWFSEGVNPVSETEVLDEVARLEQAALNKAATREAARASAMAKLSALGLDADEVSALLSG